MARGYEGGETSYSGVHSWARRSGEEIFHPLVTERWSVLFIPHSDYNAIFTGLQGLGNYSKPRVTCDWW
jgi:hypothetical protein